jgi:hypothetical protein
VNAAFYVTAAYVIGLGLLVGYAVLLMYTGKPPADRAVVGDQSQRMKKESEVDHGDPARRT